MQKRRAVLLAVGYVLAAAAVVLLVGDNWQQRALYGGIVGLFWDLLLFVVMFKFGRTGEKWQTYLWACLMLGVVPIMGVVWGAGALFPFATVVGEVVLTVGFVGCMRYKCYVMAASAALLCGLGTLAMLVIALFNGQGFDVVAACTLVLLSFVLYGLGARYGMDDWQSNLAVVAMVAAFPVGTVLWSVGLPVVMTLASGAIMCLAGLVWLIIQQRRRLAQKIT